MSTPKINRVLDIFRNHKFFTDIVYDSNKQEWRTRDENWKDEMIAAFNRIPENAKRNEHTIRKQNSSSSTSPKKAKIPTIYNIYIADVAEDGSDLPNDEDQCISILGGEVDRIAKLVLGVAATIFEKDPFVNIVAVEYKDHDTICAEVTDYYSLTNTSKFYY